MYNQCCYVSDSANLHHLYSILRELNLDENRRHHHQLSVLGANLRLFTSAPSSPFPVGHSARPAFNHSSVPWRSPKWLLAFLFLPAACDDQGVASACEHLPPSFLAPGWVSVFMSRRRKPNIFTQSGFSSPQSMSQSSRNYVTTPRRLTMLPSYRQHSHFT